MLRSRGRKEVLVPGRLLPDPQPGKFHVCRCRLQVSVRRSKASCVTNNLNKTSSAGLWQSESLGILDCAYLNLLTSNASSSLNSRLQISKVFFTI